MKFYNPKKLALIAGFSLLLMAIVAGYSYGYVYNSLILPEDPTQTLQNLQSASGLFLSGTLGWVVILILDLLVSWTLYFYFKETQRDISALTALSRVLYSVFLGYAISYLFIAGSSLKADADAQEVMAALHSFESIWSLGLIVFGFHLIGLGWLTWISPDMSRLFPILLIFAGICYVGIHSAKAFLPNSESLVKEWETILMLPMALGEIAFAVWLVIRGFKSKNTV
ncbi:DUF4386 domain-containing protein [Algoriphagus sp. CAU 1675]|uniref:DUF4386 domain-containing protein n=1 Tax=Algoriphagus sp. CAU 1675 TaxID=3032597 RepID=UPI0023DAADCF|nr:DUF4386 domain-containing protein [Algoriphagus sp. CAU 1675]MDF2159100.1 DUF4386 domain-containing protein [Algoriphagus sp. CAU 1675]